MAKSPFKHPFWSAYSGVGPKPLCVDEWLMVDISNSIRQKPDWRKKYKDETIREKWKKELAQQFGAGYINTFEDIIKFVFEELTWYEDLENLLGRFKIGIDDKVIYGDGVVAEAQKNELKVLSEKLASSMEVDYHPGSNNQVVDLVHPSLYPVVYGRTQALVNDELQVVEFSDDIEVKPQVDSWGVSKKFQWLPAVFGADKKTGRFTIDSYINNLHPLNKELYAIIEEVFNNAVPGLELCLRRFVSDQYVRIEIPQYLDVYTPEFREKLQQLLDAGYDDENRFDDYEEYFATRMDHLIDLRPQFKTPETKELKLTDFGSLKVIVKMANIELTPENPVYGGGSWHVEGTINEDIVATILYYYDVENITESTLSFRTAFEDPMYEQDDRLYCQKIFGLDDEEPAQRVLGSMKALENRLLIFPNCFQHHVDPFELADKSKKGHRKILCFFVVDPYNEKVVLSKEVPPQMENWELKEFSKQMAAKITLDEAKAYREELMEERSADNEDELAAYTRLFSLCEH